MPFDPNLVSIHFHLSSFFVGEWNKNKSSVNWWSGNNIFFVERVAPCFKGIPNSIQFNEANF